MLADRLKKVRSLMESQGFEKLFISPGPNQRYLTNLHFDYPGDSWDTIITWNMITSTLIGLDGDPILIAPKSSETWVREASKTKEVRMYSGAQNRLEIFKELLRNSKGTLGVEDHLPFKIQEQLFAAAPNIKMRSASQMLCDVRVVKSQDEVQSIRRAAGIVQRGVEVGREFVRPNVTEWEVALEVEAAMRRHGAESISYCVVQTGAKTATWDPPTDDRVKKGDLFLMDLSATYNGYHGDITRMTVVGEPNARQKRIFSVVQEAQSKAIETIREGVKAGRVNDAARKVMQENGYIEFFPFGIGHGLGLEAHESPHLTEYKDTELVLCPGIVMTIEPTINIPGEFGIRIEDDVLVTSSGSEKLTTLGRELVRV